MTTTAEQFRETENGAEVKAALLDKVLLIDNGSLEHRFLKAALTDAGYEVTSTANMDFDPFTLRCSPFASIVIDMDNPKPASMQTLYWISDFCQIPVVAIVTPETVNMVSSLPVRVDRHIFKPFRADEIKSVIGQFGKRQPRCSHHLAMTMTSPTEIKAESTPMNRRAGDSANIADLMSMSRRTGDSANTTEPMAMNRRTSDRIGAQPATASIAPAVIADDVAKSVRIELDRKAKDVLIDGIPINLSPKEFGLLSLLISKAGELVTDAEISEFLWPHNKGLTDGDVRQYVYRVRRKLEGLSVASNGDIIQNVKGRGYRAIMPADQINVDWRELASSETLQ